MLPFVAAEHESGLKVMARVLAVTPDVPSADRAALLALEGTIRLHRGRFAEGHASGDAESIALGVVGEDSLMEEAAGRAAAAGQDWEAAGRHFANALRQAHEIPSVFAQPDVRLAWAEMLIARGQDGDHARARSLLEEAAALYERAGRTRGARTCRTMLASFTGA